MELKNAGLKSELEAKHRMLDGERFKDGIWLIYYDEEEQGFRCHNEVSAKQVIYGLWSDYESWQVEVDWKESLSPENPRWCEVKVDEVIGFLKIGNYRKGDFGDRFYVINGRSYDNAKPVSAELAAMLDAEVGK